MSETLETKYLSFPLVAGELPLAQTQESPRRWNKKLIGGVSGLLIVGCVIATVCISSSQVPLGKDAIQLSSLQDSTSESGELQFNFTEIARTNDFYTYYDEGTKYKLYHRGGYGEYVAYLSKSDQFVVRSLDDFSIVYSIPSSPYKGQNIRGLHLSFDKEILAFIVGDSEIVVIELKTNSEALRYKHSEKIYSLVLSHDNKYAILDCFSSVYLYSLKTQQAVYKYGVAGYEEPNSLRYSEDLKYLIVIFTNAYYDNLTKVFKVDTQEEVFSLDGYHPEVKVLQKNKYLVFTEDSEILRIVDLQTKEEFSIEDVELLQSYEGSRSSLKFYSSDQYLAIGGYYGITAYDFNALLSPYGRYTVPEYLSLHPT